MNIHRVLMTLAYTGIIVISIALAINAQKEVPKYNCTSVCGDTFLVGNFIVEDSSLLDLDKGMYFALEECVKIKGDR